IVFAVIYVIIMVKNALFIKQQQIISLFHTTSTSEETKRKVSVLEVIMGILGIVLIIFGYYLSTKLFNGQFTTMELMFMVDRKSTRLNSSHVKISYAVFCLKKKKQSGRDVQPVRRWSPDARH